MTDADIPSDFSISKIQQSPKLLAALQALDKIETYTERAPCDYRNNSSDVALDRGCEVYLQELRQLIALGTDKLYVYYATKKFTKEDAVKSALQSFVTSISSQQALIDEKEKIIKAKKSLFSEIKDIEEESALLLATYDAEYEDTQDLKKKESLQDMMNECKTQTTQAVNQKYLEVVAYIGQEEEINAQLLAAFKTAAATPVDPKDKPRYLMSEAPAVIADPIRDRFTATTAALTNQQSTGPQLRDPIIRSEGEKANRLSTQAQIQANARELGMPLDKVKNEGVFERQQNTFTPGYRRIVPSTSPPALEPTDVSEDISDQSPTASTSSPERKKMRPD